MSYRDKTEVAGNEPIQGNFYAFTARLSDGSVSCWGHEAGGGDSSSVQSRLKNVKAVCASRGGAFAAIVGDDTVVCWGNQDCGGDCSAVAGELRQVEGLCGSREAFAALKRDGSVTTWGKADRGGDSSSVRGRLKGVKAIYSTLHAFAAVLHDGSVEAWGREDYGGLIPPSVKQRLKQVQSISGADYAFAALLSDGTVETWGEKNWGGTRGRGLFSRALTEVVSICASAYAFAALRKDGTVVCWGDEAYGGSTSRVNKELQKVVAISSTGGAFAALRSDGSVVTWGDGGSGGDSTSVAGELKEVAAIRGTGGAFAALRKNGTVVTWGDKGKGGDSSAVRGELVQVVSVSSTGWAFAARRSDGTVMTWGNKDYGGDSSSVPALRQAGAIQSTGWVEKALKGEEERKEAVSKQPEEAEHAERANIKATKEKEKLHEQSDEAERVAREKERSEFMSSSKNDKLAVTLDAAVDGSVEFWRQRLVAVLDAEDIADSASKFSAAGFKQKHVGELSRDDLKDAGVKSGVIKDFLNKQHLIGQTTAKEAVSPTPMASPSSSSSVGLLLAGLPRVPEEELTMEEQVGEGAFSVVWRATWRRKIAVGKPGASSSMQVAVKMSKNSLLPSHFQQYNNSGSNLNELSSDLARDLAVMSGLPHQNILTVHGLCEVSSSSSKKNGGGATLKIVYELMSTDLAKHLKAEAEAVQEQPQQRPLLPTHVLLRVLRDVSAGLAHLHSNGVIHRDVKPANVLLRDEQVKLCDFGSSRDLQHTIQQMSVAGTLSYMSPEMLNQQPLVGRPTDVWSFGVLLFECVTGTPCSRALSTEELVAELSLNRKCLPALVELFVECHQTDPRKRPSMHNIHVRLQTLVMQEARDSQRLKEELKRAEAQDKETYQVTWNSCYGNQPHSQELMDYLLEMKQKQQGQSVVRQPLLSGLAGKGSMEELEQLATAKLCGRVHAQMKAMVELCGGTYLCAPRKSHERCVQKVEQEYLGDYSKLLDLERATGLFEQAEDMLRCLKMLRGEEAATASSSLSSSSSAVSLAVVRCKDRVSSPLSSGYRDLLLNVCEAESGFVMELQLNFNKIAQIKSQSHRFYELIRVMEIKLAP